MTLLAAVIVLLLPGGALLAWISPRAGEKDAADLAPLAALADAAALSIALSALVGLAGFVAGLRFSVPIVAGLYGLCAVAWAAAAVRRWRVLPGERLLLRWLARWIIAVIVVALLAAWRLYQARDLALPAWVDSVHHTLVVRLILERGAVPADLAPYIPAPFIYHFGFHLVTALFAFWSRLAPAQSVLWFGQVLNALVALSVYRAAVAFRAGLVREQPAGSPTIEKSTEERILLQSFPWVAALLVTFVFQMPAYYLTWGRYTLLAGLALVGPAVAAIMDLIGNQQRPAPLMKYIQLSLLLAGLALTHYFALFLAGLFLAVVGLAEAAPWLRSREAWGVLWRLAACTLVGLALAAPWIWRVAQLSPHETSVQVIAPFDPAEAARKRAADYLQYFLYLIGPRRNHILLGLSGLGLLAALRHPRRRYLAAWAALIALLSLPWGLRINPFRPDYFAIVLFFPAALLLAGLLVDGAAALAGSGILPGRSWSGVLALILAVAGMLAWGIRETRSIINPVTVIATQADVRALDWVRVHTPADARFYMNSSAWQGNAYRGVDGGYWLEPYTGRISLVPPVFYGWGSREYVAQVTGWAKRAASIKECAPDFYHLLDEAQLNYIYLREGQGNLQPARLAECPRLQPVYQSDGVFIYHVSGTE